MKFFVIIEKNALYTYEMEDKKYHPLFIEGSESFPIEISSITEDVNAYLDALANEKNLGTRAKLEFDVLWGRNTIVNKKVEGVLGEYTDKKYLLDEVLSTVIKKLSRDKNLLIPEYGINYDGLSYKATEEGLVKGEYDLLAYTIYGDDVVSLMDMK